MYTTTADKSKMNKEQRSSNDKSNDNSNKKEEGLFQSEQQEQDSWADISWKTDRIGANLDSGSLQDTYANRVDRDMFDSQKNIEKRTRDDLGDQYSSRGEESQEQQSEADMNKYIV